MLVLFAMGLGLQSFFGAFPLAILAYPVNLITTVLLLLVAGLCCKLLSTHRITRFLSSGATALSALFFIGLMALVFGLTHQQTDAHDIPARLGIRAMTSYYPFVLSYLYLLIALSFATFRRLKWELSVLNVGFFLNHAGLLIVLLSIGLGTADKLQLRAKVKEGQQITKATAQSGRNHDLPFSLQLVDFEIQTYLPKLAIIDVQTGKYLPEGAPSFYDVDSAASSFELLQHHFLLLKYIDQASPDEKGGYQAADDNGFPPAVWLQADGKSSWVTCGNWQVPYRMFGLSATQSLVMLNPEARSYESLVQITQNGNEFQQRIAVNRPLHLGAWSVYQSSFDATQGKASSFSVFQLIYDPWKNLTQVGLAMLILGALSLFWGYQKKS